MNKLVTKASNNSSSTLYCKQGDKSKCQDKDEIREMLRIQLEEMEMLTAMFPNPGELVLTDPSTLADINEFVDGKISTVPMYLDYVINVIIEDLKLELCVNLTSGYPKEEPNLFVRSNQLSRNEQTLLNKDLMDYKSTLDPGEICVCSIVIWLQENGLTYRSKTDLGEKKKPKEERELFSRYWIYSHHIYNKTKRKEMLELAPDFNLTGFCLPGKPGIICVEGDSFNCSQFWLKVRNMTWKKIRLKKTEEEVMKPGKNIDSFRKFGKFQEISFVCNEFPTAKDRSGHMDMGEFYNYLKDHECGHVFKDYFGVDGKLGQ